MAPVGGVADGADRLHVGALHEAFCVHVRIEELGAVGLERANRFDRRDGQDCLPTVNRDAAPLAVDGSDDAIGADGLRQRACEIEIDDALAEEG